MKAGAEHHESPPRSHQRALLGHMFLVFYHHGYGPFMMVCTGPMTQGLIIGSGPPKANHQHTARLHRFQNARRWVQRTPVAVSA